METGKEEPSLNGNKIIATTLLTDGFSLKTLLVIQFKKIASLGYSRDFGV